MEPVLSLARRVYPMGDRGGTATTDRAAAHPREFIRWEIGEEPQRQDVVRGLHLVYPMGDRGGTATRGSPVSTAAEVYPMGDRGGTATSISVCRCGR